MVLRFLQVTSDEVALRPVGPAIPPWRGKMPYLRKHRHTSSPTSAPPPEVRLPAAPISNPPARERPRIEGVKG